MSRPNFLDKIAGILQRPAARVHHSRLRSNGIAISRTRPPASVQYVPLPPGVIAPSPVKENILDPAALAEAVDKLIPPATGRGKRRAALILPDNCVSIAVLDFDTLPEKEEERRPLINFRLRKSVPFDIDRGGAFLFPAGRQKSHRGTRAFRDRGPLRNAVPRGGPAPGARHRLLARHAGSAAGDGIYRSCPLQPGRTLP